jgi:hypothetical protein
MKTIRLLAASLFLVSGILHVFFAFKGNTNNSLPIWIGDGIIYLLLGGLLLMKKRFPFWLGIIPFIISLFIAPHPQMIHDYKDWILAMNYIELIAVICCTIVLLSWKRDTKSIKRFRWTLRVLSGFIIVFSVLMFIGETFFGENPGEPLSTNAIMGLSIGGIGLIGLGLAWKWEFIGGITALTAFVVIALTDPNVLQFPLLLLYPLIAILFIVLWAISRNTTVKKE